MANSKLNDLPSSRHSQNELNTQSTETSPKKNMAYSGNLMESEVISLKEIIISLKKWLKFLKLRLKIILLLGLLGFIGGGLLGYFQKNIYIAEITFVLEGGAQGSGLGSYAGLASQFGISSGINSGQGVFGGENFLALMKSRLMLEKALLTSVIVNGKSITLADFFIDINELREEWTKKNLPLKKIRFDINSKFQNLTLMQNGLISSFHQAIITEYLIIEKQDKKSSIISLKVKSKNELFSKYLAEILAKEVSQFYVETKTKKSVENLRILNLQADSIKRALNISMLGSAISSDSTPNISSFKQVLRVPSQRKQVDAQLNQAILTQLVQNIELAKLTLRTETPLIQVIDRPVLPLKVEVPNTFLYMILGFTLSVITTAFILIIRKLLVDFS